MNGNTTELCKPFIEELQLLGEEVRYVTLADKNIGACLGCYQCQNIQDVYGCVQHDDMYLVVEDILWADCIVYATPIYSWYCPTAMKSVLDRHYGLNKYYGTATGSLWESKKVALLLTHGYDREYATEPFVTGMKHLCEHSKLQYLGMYSVRDEDDLHSFRTGEAMVGAKEFARSIAGA
jgi:multimeric flavodoxin WrbA